MRGHSANDPGYDCPISGRVGFYCVKIGRALYAMGV